MKCLACGHSNFVKGPEKTVFNKVITVYRCHSCGLIFSAPLPTKSELQQYYSSGEAQDHSGFNLNSLMEKHEQFVKNPPKSYLILRDVFKHYTKNLPYPGKCLEIGCNLGVFIEIVQPLSPLIFFGIEFNKQAVDFCRTRGKFLIDSKPLEDDPFPGVQFDCIVMFDVLEHIPHPVEFIEIMKKRLTPQGLILLALPNASSWSSKLVRIFRILKGKDIFPTVEPPFHLYGYSWNNLKMLFARCGFEMLFYKYYMMEHFDNHHQKINLHWNLNLFIGILISKIQRLSQDDKIVILFRKAASLTNNF